MRRLGWAALGCLCAVQACGGETPSDPLLDPAGLPPSAAMNQPSGSGKPNGDPGKVTGGSAAPAKPEGDGSTPAPGKPGAPPELARSEKARIESPTVSDAARKALADGNGKFAFELYGALASADSGNLFFSPYSVSSALAMTYAGARGNTAAEMQMTLHFELPDEQLHAAFNATDRELTAKPADADGNAPFTLDVANALWAQRGKTFAQDYLDTLSMHYGAGVQLLDFMTDTEGARLTINGWVEDKTHDRIKDLLHPDDLSADTAFVLTNAIYFKAKWRHDFEEAATTDAPFHAPGGDETAKMMHRLLNTSYAKGDGYQAISLPYASSSTEMLLILPDGGKLADVEARLDEALIGSIDDAASGYMVTLSLPRFQFDSRFEVEKTLDTLGIHDAFSAAADFSGMDGERDIQLSKVIHQAFVAVDEHGTEAAAATAVIGVTTSAPLEMPAVDLTVDRPFIVLIRKLPNGEILFLGRVQSVAK